MITHKVYRVTSLSKHTRNVVKHYINATSLSELEDIMERSGHANNLMILKVKVLAESVNPNVIPAK